MMIRDSGLLFGPPCTYPETFIRSNVMAPFLYFFPVSLLFALFPLNDVDVTNATLLLLKTFH